MVALPALLQGQSPGWVRLSAWIWFFSSQHRMIACSGGGRYKPTTAVSFSTKCGPLGQLEGLDTAWLAPVPSPNTLDLSRAQLQVRCQTPDTPLRGVHWRLLQGHLDDLGLLFRRQCARASRPHRVVQQPVHPFGQIALAPACRHAAVNPQHLADLDVLPALRRQQHDPGTLGHSHLDPLALRQNSQAPVIGIRQLNHFRLSASLLPPCG